VAERQGVAAQSALSLAVSDALFANAARERAPVGIASSIERAAAARSLLEQLADQADRAGPPSESELAAAARERWLELDRPDAVVTHHAVVRNDKAEKEAAARKVAERIAAAVAPVTDANEFLRIAKGVANDGFDLRAEALPAITSDGRAFSEREGKLVESNTTFDVDYSRAANAIEQPSQQSQIVKTKFGFHVIRMEKRIAGKTLPDAERKALLEPEVKSRRAARLRRELLERLRDGVRVERDRAVDELTSRVKAVP